MDNSTIAVMAWILQPLVRGAAEAALEKAGRGFVSLVDRIRARFDNNLPQRDEELANAIAEMLRHDRELLNEAASLLREFAGQVQVEASGTRSVAIGGNVQGSTIITGDHNIAGRNNNDD